ncbi:hypothetical protein [Rhodococcus erythropolis]|uniref:hypothetical protein n=1 Tax=Rhodococcus erythropolis TaxID=1833 RepID=UPI0022275E09|nr:hypothetical protein [Rhodococcus erythropolis]MCW2295483.1 hypothetical protein [Rhodococcus erythropolis]
MADSAARVLPVFEDLVGVPLPIHVRCWDGSEAGPPGSAVRVVFRNRRALRRILYSPNELGLVWRTSAGNSMSTATFSRCSTCRIWYRRSGDIESAA